MSPGGGSFTKSSFPYPQTNPNNINTNFPSFQVPGPVPVGRRSREGSMFSNHDGLAMSAPATPVESPYNPNRHAFSPMHSSGLTSSFQNQPHLAGAFPGNAFPSTLSTTPLEPPPTWMQTAASVGGIDWNAAMQNAVAWPEIPQQQTPNQQHFQQQLSSSFQPQSFPGSQQSYNDPSASTHNENASNVNDDIDPALFDTLAELIEQSQKQANGSTTTSPFDLMGALSQAPSPQAAPLAPPPPPPQGSSGMSQSLLTRRLQHHQGGANGMNNNQQPPPNQSLFNLQNVLGTSPSVQQPQHMQQPHQQSQLSGSLPGTHMSGSFGPLPTPPPSFGSSMNTSRQVKMEQSPKTPWPLPERAPAYSDTPVTTPGGSDHGIHSPVDVSMREGGIRMQELTNR